MYSADRLVFFLVSKKAAPRLCHWRITSVAVSVVRWLSHFMRLHTFAWMLLQGSMLRFSWLSTALTSKAHAALWHTAVRACSWEDAVRRNTRYAISVARITAAPSAEYKSSVL
ncbi:hypothetical protein MTO96_042386 [Rhipicephalus appendiculatus]